MTALILAIVLTLGMSAVCSLLEAFILGIQTSEIEGVKRLHPHLGARLERFKITIDESSSAILTLNTIANTMGATVVGAIAAGLYEGDPEARLHVGIITGGLTLGILFISEIIPKNLGFVYRRELAPFLTIPLHGVRVLMFPLSFVAKQSVRFLLPRDDEGAPAREGPKEEEEEIVLLAEKHSREGSLEPEESDMITNALALDSVKVKELMTPRTVVDAIDESITIGELLEKNRIIAFGRLPVYKETTDHIVAVVRRRDILQFAADDRLDVAIGEIGSEPLFIPENATALQALRQFLARHQQFGVVVDEYGSMAGVISVEDIVEHIIGDEIYEEGEVVDLRDLARRKAMEQKQANDAEDAEEVANGASMEAS